MVKTLGSVDRVRHRKKRSDFKKKRKFYRGKKVIHKRKYNGKTINYKSQRKDGDPLKFYFWSIDRMSVKGLHHWSKDMRPKVHRLVYGKNRLRIDIDPQDINTKEKFEQYCENLLWEGNFLILMWTHRNNKYHCSPRAVASVRIKNTKEGLRARLSTSYKNRSIARFSWFHK